MDAHRQLSSQLTDRTQNLSERNPDHLEADVKRLLLLCAISTSILTCLDKPAGLLFAEMEDGVGGNRGPALVLASLDGTEGT